MTRTKTKKRTRTARRWILFLSLLALALAVLIWARAPARRLPWREAYMEYGPGMSNALDSGALSDPGTKTGRDLAAFVTEAWENRWGYVWGTFGYELSEDQLAFKLAQYPDRVGRYETFIRENWIGRRTADCVGLIKAYAWYDPEANSIGYASGVMPDIDTEELFEAAAEKGSIQTIPEIPGLIVYRSGHVGVYVGDGYVIEAYGTEAGVVKTKLEERPFTHWLKCPYFDYDL